MVPDLAAARDCGQVVQRLAGHTKTTKRADGQNRLSLPGEKFSLAVFSGIGEAVCTFWENWRHPFSGVLKIDVTVFTLFLEIWAILGISHTPKIGPPNPSTRGDRLALV